MVHKKLHINRFILKEKSSTGIFHILKINRPSYQYCCYVYKTMEFFEKKKNENEKSGQRTIK
jgi:hypothetical protein